MSSIRLFENGSVATCLKKHLRADSFGGVEGEVVHQNPACKRICGEREGTFCNSGCMRTLKPDRDGSMPIESVTVTPGVDMNGESVDLVMIHDPSNATLVTLLCSQEPRRGILRKRLEACGLTPREMEIALAVSCGQSRASISSRLFISKATLKTHLNNLYRKLPAHFRKALKARAVPRGKFTP